MEDIVIQGDIQFTRSTHEYIFLPTKKKLTSVSTIIKTVYNKKSWDGVDEDVIANARERGIRVDDYVAAYIKYGRIEMANEREDVIERVKIAIDLLEQNYGNAEKIEAQKIVYDLDYGVAGTADIAVNGKTVVDLKATWSPEVDWILQIGGYAWLGGYSDSAIIHTSPRFYKKQKYPFGGKLLTYDTYDCIQWWKSALQWWCITKDMESAAKEKTVKA